MSQIAYLIILCENGGKLEERIAVSGPKLRLEDD